MVIDGVLYGTNPRLKCFAVDAATGKERWVFDPSVHNERMFGMGNNRGLSYYSGKDLAGTQVQRLFYAAGPWLYSLDPATGKTVASFGEDGRISLKTGLGEAAQDQFIVSSTPGIVLP